MQKKLIALAVSGLLSGVAFAQSTGNVTVYGIVDAGYGYYSDAIAANAESISKIDGNQWSTSRFGFKGSEDLGNGLSANFQLEASMLPDVATVGGRNSWVSLKSASIGELKLGSFGTFHDDLIGSTNVMKGNSTAASPGPVYVLTSGSKETGDFRNAVAYYSPSMGGLQLKLGASTQASGDQEVEPSPSNVANPRVAIGSPATLPTNGRVYAAAAHYANGPLIAGITYEHNEYQSTGIGYDSGNEWHLAAAYDFGVARVSGAYGTTNYADNAEIRDDRKQWQLGVSAPVGKAGMVAVNYAHAKLSYDNGLSADTVSMWGVGYFHALSKRTNLYAVYGDINQDDSNVTKSRFNGSTKTTTATTGALGYESAFQMGIRHQF